MIVSKTGFSSVQAIKKGRDPTPVELHLHVHTHGHDGKSFVDERSRVVHDRINRTGFTEIGPRYRIYLPEPILPEIPKGSARSLSYRIGTDLDRTGTGSYQIIVYR
ncbi:hypothetical protein KY285_001037 [Solanum tuberosum]|nr:hypothetical protein KY285_001037 [Solanum tuberosum]